MRLCDIFDIDESTFCTILEYCNGGDLDEHLQRKQQIPLREAKFIVRQVVEVRISFSKTDLINF